MDDKFKQLQEAGHNCVDSLMEWIKECKHDVYVLAMLHFNAEMCEAETRRCLTARVSPSKLCAAKIIDKTKEAEDRALKLFEEINDRQNVELDKFKEVVGKLAEQEKKSADQFSQMLVESMPKLQEAMAKAAAAFQETMSKK